MFSVGLPLTLIAMTTTSPVPNQPSADPAPSGSESTTVASLYSDLDAEFASTRRVLERFPEGKDAWRPHEKSRALGQLAVHVAELVNLGTIILEADELDVAEPRPLPTLGTAAELVEFFGANVERFKSALASATLADLDRPWTLRMKEKVFFTAPKRGLLRSMMINHLIHHRAQLGVYYRLLGVPVPGLYGPSADEPM